MTRAGAAALTLALSACAADPPDFAALDGWGTADHTGARIAVMAQCVALGRDCPAAEGEARAWFERHFLPSALPGADTALITGYFEPVLAAAPAPDADFPVPLHAPPADAAALRASRAEIGAGALAGRAPVLYWLADPVEAFFLHVQGSGRLMLPDGRMVRVGYAGRNAHSYRSIGRIAVERGLLPAEGLTADRLKDWLRADPERGAALMAENPSYIFFREVEGLEEDDGPIGALGLPLTPLGSVALDPAHYPPGSLVWIEAEGPDGPIRRLMLAQDTGSAIRGPGRADIFFGTGAEAGRRAGALTARGRIVRLVPAAREAEG